MAVGTGCMRALLLRNLEDQRSAWAGGSSLELLEELAVRNGAPHIERPLAEHS